jgi:hypothetical protein
MQEAQIGNNYEDDTQFEIKDFRETLSKCIEEDENKIYGYKNKPRNQEPSMFDLLSWKDDDGALWNYTKREKQTIEANICNQLKYKINKSSSHWVTENMDQFRKFTYSPSKKGVFFDVENPESKTQQSASKVATISKEFVDHLGRTQKDQENFVREVPAKSSEALDKYAIQDLKNIKDVIKVIENRAINKGGEIIRNPIAERITDEIEQRNQPKYRSASNDGKVERERKGQNDKEDSEEDIKVEKADYSNVQSRLLTKTIKKAKELDPVYEKDRLDRREDRIKKLNETTRWLPNSAFKTYFGKAPFENYGRGNVNPTVGGTVYGDYLKSHNVNPHSGDNRPEYRQIYGHADLAATKYPESQPEPPRKCKDDIRLSQKQVEELKRRNPLVPEKFRDDSKKIHKPDLVNSLRFASEENTPDNSFEEEKSKPNLSESLKQLNKKTRVIREENTKQSGSDSGKGRNKKMEKAYRATQELIKQGLKASASAKKEGKENAQKFENKKTTLSQTDKSKAKAKAQGSNKKGGASTQNKGEDEWDIAEDFNYTGGNGAKLSSPSKNERPATATDPQSNQKGRSNASQGVRDLMQDPASAFNEKPKDKNKGIGSPKTVSFKQAPENKSASKAFVQSDYGKVEGLQTLIKETQKNEKLWNKVNEDMDGTLTVNAMEPPKDYLFSLAQKETDPRYYKNVPSVWLNRIPYAGKKNQKSEDIKGVFDYAN